ALTMLESSVDGLSSSQVEDRLKECGFNEVYHEKAPSWFRQLIQSFINPFIGILIIIALVSLVTDVWLAQPGEEEYRTVIVVG
ncbi:cation-transporting P-type ATPase, partial [Acinetobacter baumannii]